MNRAPWSVRVWTPAINESRVAATTGASVVFAWLFWIVFATIGG